MRAIQNRLISNILTSTLSNKVDCLLIIHVHEWHSSSPYEVQNVAKRVHVNGFSLWLVQVLLGRSPLHDIVRSLREAKERNVMSMYMWHRFEC
jgi:hypothetical protein